MPDDYLSKGFLFGIGKYLVDFRIGLANDSYGLRNHNGSGIGDKVRIFHAGVFNDDSRVEEVSGFSGGFYCHARKIKGGQAGFAISAYEVEGFQGSILLSGSDEVKPIKANGIIGKLLNRIGGIQFSLGADYAEYIDGIQVAPVCYAGGGNHSQFGIITIRGGEGKWYKKVTPLYGRHKER